jgi:phosphopantetheinyl transferase
MMEPVWRDHSIDLDGERYGGPLALYIDLNSPAAQTIMVRAALDERDLRDFAGRGDASFRLARRRLAKALLAWGSGAHPQTVRIGRSPLGAPVVEEPSGWHVSVAGGARHCLIGIARQAVGVDIEPCSALPPPLDMLTSRERASIEALSGEDARRAALTIWVAKEAHGKRIGLASRLEPTEIEVSGTEVRSAGYRSIFELAPFGGIRGAIALDASVFVA